MEGQQESWGLPGLLEREAQRFQLGIAGRYLKRPIAALRNHLVYNARLIAEHGVLVVSKAGDGTHSVTPSQNSPRPASRACRGAWQGRGARLGPSRAARRERPWSVIGARPKYWSNAYLRWRAILLSLVVFSFKL